MSETDEQYVRLCLDGQPEAFRHLVERHQGPLLSYLGGRLLDGELASEIAQESFVRAYFALRKLRQPRSFFPWLVGIAERVAWESSRAEQRERQAVQLRHETAETAPERVAGQHDVVRRAVHELPEMYREAVLLRYYGGRSCAEVARALDVPLTTVTKRLSRAYAMLRESLRPGRSAGEQ